MPVIPTLNAHDFNVLVDELELEYPAFEVIDYFGGINDTVTSHALIQLGPDVYALVGADDEATLDEWPVILQWVRAMTRTYLWVITDQWSIGKGLVLVMTPDTEA